jgi:hypothetical protein
VNTKRLQFGFQLAPPHGVQHHGIIGARTRGWRRPPSKTWVPFVPEESKKCTSVAVEFVKLGL